MDLFVQAISGPSGIGNSFMQALHAETAALFLSPTKPIPLNRPLNRRPRPRHRHCRNAARERRRSRAHIPPHHGSSVLRSLRNLREACARAQMTLLDRLQRLIPAAAAQCPAPRFLIKNAAEAETPSRRSSSGAWPGTSSGDGVLLTERQTRAPTFHIKWAGFLRWGTTPRDHHAFLNSICSANRVY